MYKFNQYEREVILTTSDGDDCWNAYVASRTWYNKFKKQGWELLKEETYSDGTFKNATFTARKAAVSIRSAIPMKRSKRKNEN